MSNKGAKYYLAKAATVVAWLKKGKNAELAEAGKLDGRSAEIVGAQVEVLNEVQHAMSSTDTLNAYFAMAVAGDDPSKRLPDLFKQLESEQAESPILNAEVIRQLRSMLAEVEEDCRWQDKEEYNNALVKAIRVMELTNRFLTKKGSER